MEFLEKDLEDIIYEAENFELREHDLMIVGDKFRQKKIGNYGIADIITIQKPVYNEDTKMHSPMVITVFELKKDNITDDAFFQAVRYIKGIDQYIQSRMSWEWDYTFKITLIGKNRPHKGLLYLPDFMFNDQGDSFLEIYTYSYTLEGLFFKLISGYSLIDEGF